MLQPYVHKYNTDHGEGQCYQRILYKSTVKTIIKGRATNVLKIQDYFIISSEKLNYTNNENYVHKQQ